jgi:transcriptional regulator of PTS gene
MDTNFLTTFESNSRNEALKKRIIHLFIANGDSTISELCKEIDMSIPTVTKLLYDLQKDDLIIDYGKMDNTNGGRKPSVFGLNPESGYFIGVDVQHNKIIISGIDFKGNVLKTEEHTFSILENSRESLDLICEIINQFIDSLSITLNKILAVGINLSGRVNPTSGYSYSIFNFDDRPLSEVMQEKLHVRVYVENDTRAMAYGEYKKGIAKNEKNIIFINVTWGLGIGIIINGQLYYGKSGFSGEFGHFPFFDNEVICHCGKKGCFETEASGSAICRLIKEQCLAGRNSILCEAVNSGRDLTVDDIIEAARKEDTLTIDILEQIGLNLGRGIAGLINIFNPELVVIGGPLSQTGDYLRLPIKSNVKKYSLNLVNEDSEIKISCLGETAGAIGTCLLSRGKLLGTIQI